MPNLRYNTIIKLSIAERKAISMIKVNKIALVNVNFNFIAGYPTANIT